MNATDTTRSATARKGDPTVTETTTTTETGEAPAVPTAFLPPADSRCERNAWCTKTGTHDVCIGRTLGMEVHAFQDPDWPTPTILEGYLEDDREDDWVGIVYDRGNDNPRRLDTSDELRAETARVRAHLARLDALADQLDAIHEAGGQTSPAASLAGSDGHYPWCVPGGCRTTTFADGSTLTAHEGPENVLPNRGALRGYEGPLLSSRLAADTELPDPAVHVTYRNEGAPYSAGEARALIGDFEAFLGGLKAQVAHLDGTPAEPRQAFCGKHAWCTGHETEGAPGRMTLAHLGDMLRLPAPRHEHPAATDPQWLVRAQLWASDAAYEPRAYVVQNNPDSDELSLDADQLGEFVAQVGAFRDGLAAMHGRLLQAKADHR
jgi:hypothetical protein